jgi:O-antigen/teichoic acid export membrane protein
MIVLRDGQWRVRRAVRVEVWRRLFRIALPLALAGGATTIYMNIDSVLLGYFGRLTETGWYNLATRVVGILLVPTGLLSIVIFPAFASTASHVDEAFRRRWDAWAVGMAALGAYLACVVLATADSAVGWVFGAAFRPAGLVLKILAVAVFLVFVYTPSFQAMIVFDRQRTLSWALLSGAALNVILNLALIPAYGMYGAAWATVATHAVLLCAMLVLSARTTPVTPMSGVVAGGLLGAGVAAGLACAVMIASKLPLWLAVPLGTLVYAAAFLGVGRTRAAAAAVTLLGR